MREIAIPRFEAGGRASAEVAEVNGKKAIWVNSWNMARPGLHLALTYAGARELRSQLDLALAEWARLGLKPGD